MKIHLINNDSNTLLLFFTGWGCDEYEFEHLKTDSDVLILYDYNDLTLNFDFSKYKEINILAFSAGVFVASVFNFDFKTNKKIAVSGNPYLFDEHFGLSQKTQDFLCNITEETADDFAKNYLVKTEEEYANFHNSKRTLDSCEREFEYLKQLYETKKQDIKDIFDIAIIGENDPLFNPSAQKEFYGNRLNIIKNARHNMFFRIKSYGDILRLADAM